MAPFRVAVIFKAGFSELTDDFPVFKSSKQTHSGNAYGNINVDLLGGFFDARRQRVAVLFI